MFKIFLALILMTGCAYADVYVTTDKNGSVYDISNAPDAVVPAGYTRVDLAGQSISNLQIVPPYQNYNYINGAFVLNASKVNSDNAAIAAQAATQAATQTALCTDYASYMGLATSLGLPAQATTAQIQTALTTLEGDGTNQANVNNATKIGLEFLALMNDIQQNGSNWANIKACN